MLTYTLAGLVDYIATEYRLFCGRLMDVSNHVSLAQSTNTVMGKIQTRLDTYCSAYTFRAVTRDGVDVMLEVQRRGDAYRLEERRYEH